MYSNFYEIWHLEQIEHADYEYKTWNWLSWRKIIDSGKFGPSKVVHPFFMKFGAQNRSSMLIMNIILASV